MRNIAEVKMRRGTPNHDFYIHSFTHNIQTDSNICAGTYIIKALIHRHIHTHLMNMSTQGKDKSVDRNKIQIHMQTRHRQDTCIMQAPSSSQTHSSPTQPPRRRPSRTMAKDTPQHTHVPAIMRGQRSCLAVIPTKTFLKTSL